MPSGYTAIIEEKPDVTFREYALRCSRAFGAFIMMRDEPLDAKIPSKFHPDDYHKKELKKAQTELQRAKSVGLEEAALEADLKYRNAVENHIEALQRTNNLRTRYETMLQEARNYQPPTKDHEEFKKFMVSQLEESIKFDCSYSEREAPKKQPPKQYKAQLIADAERDVTYHQKGWEKEVARARERTEWVQALVKSLPEK